MKPLTRWFRWLSAQVRQAPLAWLCVLLTGLWIVAVFCNVRGIGGAM